MNMEMTIKFYNVAEMAIETKRLKKLEQETKKFRRQRNEDELSAAIGLIMLQYQSKALKDLACEPPHTPPEQMLTSTLKIQQQPPADTSLNSNKNSNNNNQMKNVITIDPVQYFNSRKRRSTSSMGSEVVSARRLKLVNPEIKVAVPVTNKSSTSLLASCRNILKEFLNQHGNGKGSVQ